MCLPDDVVLALGVSVGRLTAQGAANGRLLLCCGNTSCYGRRTRVSAALQVPHRWTRDGFTDAFHLHAFMPSCWLSWQPPDMPW